MTALERTCRCFCRMTHAVPGRAPEVACEGRAVVIVKVTNRPVRDVPMCEPCAGYAAGQPGFVGTRPAA